MKFFVKYSLGSVGLIYWIRRFLIWFVFESDENWEDYCIIKDFFGDFVYSIEGIILIKKKKIY